MFLLSSVLTSVSQEAKKKAESMDKMWGETTVSVGALKAGRGKLFDEGNFGLFIHWGLFSHLGGKWQGKTYYGIGEWIMNPRMAGEWVLNSKEGLLYYWPKSGTPGNHIVSTIARGGTCALLISKKWIRKKQSQLHSR